MPAVTGDSGRGAGAPAPASPSTPCAPVDGTWPADDRSTGIRNLATSGPPTSAAHPTTSPAGAPTSPAGGGATTAPGGTFVHRVLTGLDPASRGLREGESAPGAVEGANDYGGTGHGGPRPPVGDPAHRYFFRHFVVSEPVATGPGATAGDGRRAMEGREVARGTLVGTYQRLGAVRDQPGTAGPDVGGRRVASWVCTGSEARPVVAHAGWRTTPDTAVRTVLATSTGAARTPVPLQSGGWPVRRG